MIMSFLHWSKGGGRSSALIGALWVSLADSQTVTAITLAVGSGWSRP